MSKRYFSKEYFTLRVIFIVAIFLLMNLTWVFIVSSDGRTLASIFMQKDMLLRLFLGLLETCVIVELSFNLVWRAQGLRSDKSWGHFILAAVLLLVAITVLSLGFSSLNEFSIHLFIRNGATDFIMAIFTCVIFVFLIQKNRINEMVVEREKIVAEKARLAEAAAIAQSDAMNIRIDNHFFFNSLNILASLIGEDPKKAEEFLLELSATHRDIITLGSVDTITINKELKLVESYMKMTSYRFGNDAIRLVVDDEVGDYMSSHIIPLSLLHAVENAIKHNSYSKEHPLVIDVTMERSTNGCSYVKVVNNKMEKISKPVSTKQGLENIRKKYNLVSGQEPVVEETEDTFTVKLPLIEKWTY